jgi:SAM-dependent methyltransferase
MYGRSGDCATALESMSFQDHFSDRAAQYARSRPLYPVELIDFLADVSPRAELAWEAGCGSGQFTRLLSANFKRVAATDASVQQLSFAPMLHGVSYHCALAEACALVPSSADLVVAAAAAHWFDLPHFYEEARRVGGPDSAIALITYHHTTVMDEVDVVMREFHEFLLDGHWPPERRHVDSAYTTFDFPFPAIDAPPFEIVAQWKLDQLLGYVDTWSGVRALINAGGEAKLQSFREAVGDAWGDSETVRTVRWPLALKLGRIHG